MISEEAVVPSVREGGMDLGKDTVGPQGREEDLCSACGENWGTAGGTPS